MNLKVREKQQELNLIEYQMRNLGFAGGHMTNRARSNLGGQAEVARSHQVSPLSLANNPL